MPTILKKEISTNPFLDAYTQLNEKKKEELREKFLEKFDYESPNTFYMKLNQNSPLWSIEKEFISEWLKQPVKKLFPKAKEVKSVRS
jgi:hypothetical protein